MNAEQFIDFELSAQTINITLKVDEKLEALRSFLDLLRMRLSIQEDFTLGGIVNFFDPSKKGYITAADLKNADVLKSMDQLEDDDLHYVLEGIGANQKRELRDRIDYQAFVKLFMPVTDKRFTTLII